MVIKLLVSTEQHRYNIDLGDLKKGEHKIGEVTIINDVKQNSPTTHNWNITLLFRNYRDYNQTINADKKIVGELSFVPNGCVRTK